MITVLWVMTVASVIALAAALSGRNTVNAARNRVQSERAFWTALGCARRMQATIDGLLRDAPTLDDAAQVWRVLEHSAASSALLQGTPCSLRLEAAGTRLDVNSASDEMMTALLRAIGTGDDEASSMIAALDDWRDSDDVARPVGAERDWYLTAVRRPPRNGSLADIRELAEVRGFESLSRFDSVLTTEPGRVSLATAPATVLRAVPGFTPEVAEMIATLHDAGTPIRDPLALLGRISTESADAMMNRYSDIARITTADPDAWLLTIRASSGFPASTVSLEWRLSRAGRRCVVVRTRTVL